MDSVRRIEDSIIGPEPSGEYCVDHYNYFGPETTTKGRSLQLGGDNYGCSINIMQVRYMDRP